MVGSDGLFVLMTFYKNVKAGDRRLAPVAGA
jgi:hypothetical protein